MYYKSKKIIVSLLVLIFIVSNVLGNVFATSVRDTIDSIIAKDISPEAKIKEREDYARQVEISSNKRKKWPQGPIITSPAAVLMDIDSGVTLYSKDASEQFFPASITKVYTAFLACENSAKDTKVTFSHSAIYDNMEPGSANMGFVEGEEITMDVALKCMMSASANEVANAIAETVSGSNEKFAELMNKRALELGCKNSHFVNPSGLHNPNHYISANDMAIISAYAYKNSWFREVCALPTYKRPITNLNNEEWIQVNKHQMFRDTENYYKYCTGGKVGGTDEAHSTLVTYAEKGNKKLVAVVLCSISGQTFPNSRALFDYGFDNFLKTNLTKFKSKYGLYNDRKIESTDKTKKNSKTKKTAKTNNKSKSKTKVKNKVVKKDNIKKTNANNRQIIIKIGKLNLTKTLGNVTILIIGLTILALIVLAIMYNIIMKSRRKKTGNRVKLKDKEWMETHQKL